MRSASGWQAVRAGALFLAAGVISSTAAAFEVVADEACALHAVDIASFATCEGDRVARPDADQSLPPGAPGLHVVADEACERYAVDIASFATCEGGRVTRPEGT